LLKYRTFVHLDTCPLFSHQEKPLIQLDNTLLIGQGRDRACYQHPENKELCIKVALKPEKQSKREKNYLEYLKSKNRDLGHVSQYHGTIQTNLGTGYLFDLARDSDGKIAMTLKSAIKKKIIKETEVIRLISELENYLYSEKICVYDLSPSNIVVQKDTSNKWQFTLIDGLGVATPNPLIKRTNILTENLLTRSFQRLRNKVDKTFKYTKLNATPPPKKREPKHIKLLKRFGMVITLSISVFAIFYFELIEL